MKKDLVLTILTRYTFRKIEPFFRTLRKTGYSGEIVVFYDIVDKKTLSSIKKWGVRLIKFNSIKYFNNNIKIVHYRFKLFYELLKKEGENYNKIFICDIRDLVFQKDPFDYDGYSKINYFCENDPINRSNINSYILKRAGGEDALKKYGDNLVSCAGTTIGDSNEILKYLKFMSENLVSGNPIDQGQHNFFFYSGKIKESKCFHNFFGPILTISNLNKSKIKFDSQGNVINNDGSIINIIHQYDRNNKLLWLFNSFNNYILDVMDYEYISLKRFVKKILFNFPLIKIYFRKKYHNPSEFD